MMNAANFRELVYSTYGGAGKTPLAIQHALALLDREHHATFERTEKVWYERLKLKTRSA